MKKISFIFLLLIVLLACDEEKKKDKVDYRDTFVGKYIGLYCVSINPAASTCEDSTVIEINKESKENELGLSIANEYAVFTVNADGNFEQFIPEDYNQNSYISGQFFEDSIDLAYYSVDQHYFNGIKE